MSNSSEFVCGLQRELTKSCELCCIIFRVEDEEGEDSQIYRGCVQIGKELDRTSFAGVV